MTAKKNPWFRMYSDFMFDEKIEFLAFEDQRHYVFILCMKNSGLIDKDYTQPGMRDRVVAKRLGLFGEAFEAAKKRLVESGLIDSEFQPLAWEKRQFISDVSTDRVKAYRERMKQPRNVSETAQDTDTEAETDKTTAPAGADAWPGFAEFWKTWPSSERKQAKGKCLEAWKKAKAEAVSADVVSHVKQLKASEGWTKQNAQFIPAPLVYLSQRRWEGAEHEPGSSASAVGHFV